MADFMLILWMVLRRFSSFLFVAFLLIYFLMLRLGDNPFFIFISLMMSERCFVLNFAFLSKVFSEIYRPLNGAESKGVFCEDAFGNLARSL